MTNIAAPIIVPTPVVVPSDGSGGSDWADTAAGNWVIFGVTLAAAILFAAGAMYLVHVGRSIWGGDELDWPMGIEMAAVMLGLLALVALVGTCIAYIIGLVNGWITLWSLLIPAAAVVYAVRRTNRFIAAKRADRVRR